MLFDLRSRRRRGAVKVIYASLAVLMVVGLVGLGIGTGSSGGLLNAGGNGGSGPGNSANNALVKQAIKLVDAHPSAANWANLMKVRYGVAGSGSNYDSTTSTYTTAGKRQLTQAAAAWRRYLALSHDRPTLDNAIIAARTYQSLSLWPEESQAWNYAVQSAPAGQRLTPYYCLALSAYAAKNTTTGALAAAAAVRLTPKLQRLSQKSALQSAASSTSTAHSLLLANC
ncbi:MAG: hypothetical protein M0T77_06770 [Actinomycetota bacterium]|nr:hypothetical protein [Actinomycetota bacterium]